MPLRSAIAASARPRISEVFGANISSLAWAFSVILFSPNPLLESISASAIANSNQATQLLRPLEWGNLARAYWLLAYDSDTWNEAILKHVEALRQEGNLWSGELSTAHKFGQPRAMSDMGIV